MDDAKEIRWRGARGDDARCPADHSAVADGQTGLVPWTQLVSPERPAPPGSSVHSCPQCKRAVAVRFLETSTWTAC